MDGGAPQSDSERRAAALGVQVEVRRMMARLTARMERIRAAAREPGGAKLTPPERALQRQLWWEVVASGGLTGVAAFALARRGGVGRGLSVLCGGLGAHAVGMYAFAQRMPPFLEACVALEDPSPLVDDVLCPTLADFRRIVDAPAHASVFKGDDARAKAVSGAARLWDLCDARAARLGAGDTADRAADGRWGGAAIRADDGWGADDVAGHAADDPAKWYTPPQPAWGDDDDPAARR